MSDFFDSEIIQEELKEINNMQEKIYGSLFGFAMMTHEEKLEHIDNSTKFFAFPNGIYINENIKTLKKLRFKKIFLGSSTGKIILV